MTAGFDTFYLSSSSRRPKLVKMSTLTLFTEEDLVDYPLGFESTVFVLCFVWKIICFEERRVEVAEIVRSLICSVKRRVSSCRQKQVVSTYYCLAAKCYFSTWIQPIFAQIMWFSNINWECHTPHASHPSSNAPPKNLTNAVSLWPYPYMIVYRLIYSKWRLRCHF